MSKFHLFEVFGVELEYAIVDRDTLKVRPIADDLIKEMTGEFVSDVDRGELAWSNELVAHVIELKTNGPAKSLDGLSEKFAEEVQFINQILASKNAMLLPTGAHPLFKPLLETVIWPHEYNEVYALYDRIFGCKGHGWSNLQSTHINLPFANDEEFEKLHAAVRVLLPLIPAIAASTPIIEAKPTGFIDTRLEYYRRNQQKIPAIAGLVVPEPAFSQKQYEEMIFAQVARAIEPYDEEKILDKHFLNSRGAIARFDRGAIEIRVIDIQECPKADLAILELISASLQWLIERFEGDLETLKHTCSTEELANIFNECVKYGSLCETSNQTFLGLFGMAGSANMRLIWEVIYEQVKDRMENGHVVIKTILNEGNLSERMLQRFAEDPSEAGVVSMYKDLADCLQTNQVFRV